MGDAPTFQAAVELDGPAGRATQLFELLDDRVRALEGVDEAVDEVRSFFEGTPMLDHSYLATLDGEVASAVLVLVSEGEPFIGYVMTHPAHKGRGVARHLVRNAMASLKDDGWRRVISYITQGNAPSEALFRSVGALQVAED